MLSKVISSISGVFGDSQFESYLSRVQAGGAIAPSAHEALHDYMDIIRAKGIGPW